MTTNTALSKTESFILKIVTALPGSSLADICFEIESNNGRAFSLMELIGYTDNLIQLGLLRSETRESCDSNGYIKVRRCFYPVSVETTL